MSQRLEIISEKRAKERTTTGSLLPIVEYTLENRTSETCESVQIDVRSFKSDGKTLLKESVLHAPNLRPGEKALVRLTTSHLDTESRHTRLGELRWTSGSGTQRVMLDQAAPLKGYDWEESMSQLKRLGIGFALFLAFIVVSFKACTYH